MIDDVTNKQSDRRETRTGNVEKEEDMYMVKATGLGESGTSDGENTLFLIGMTIWTCLVPGIHTRLIKTKTETNYTRDRRAILGMFACFSIFFFILLFSLFPALISGASIKLLSASLTCTT